MKPLAHNAVVQKKANIIITKNKITHNAQTTNPSLINNSNQNQQSESKSTHLTTAFLRLESCTNKSSSPSPSLLKTLFKSISNQLKMTMT